jgi:hypothetical protein
MTAAVLETGDVLFTCGIWVGTGQPIWSIDTYSPTP